MSSSKTSKSTVSVTKKVYWEVPILVPIPNFSRAFFTEYETGKRIESETFPIKSGNKITTKWFLVLWPNGETEEVKSNVGLYLHCQNAEDTAFDFTAKYKFGVQKSNGEDCFISTAELVRSKEQLMARARGGYGHPKFLSHEKLFNEEHGYVVAGELIVFVELTVKTEIAKPSPKIARTSPFADFKKMFEIEAFVDFELKTISDDGVLKAHRAILAARSPMFFAMLTSDMQEAKQGFVSVPDFDSKVMKEVLRFIYCNEVEGLSEIVSELIYAAEKYQLEELKDTCLQEITSSLRVVNAVKFLIIAYELSDEDLFQKCFDLIVNNYDRVSKEPSWEELPKNLLSKLFGRSCKQHNNLII